MAATIQTSRVLRVAPAAALAFGLAAAARAQDPFGATASLPAGDVPRVAVALTVPERHYLYAEQVFVEPVGNARLVAEHLPEPKRKHDVFSGSEVGVYDADVVLTYRIEGDPAALSAVRVGYQGCSDSLCYLPQERTLALAAGGAAPAASGVPGEGERGAPAAFRVAGRAAGYLRSAELLSFLDRVEEGRGLEGDGLGAVIEQRGFWFALALIVLGGLALNLTPCVLPMIPINLAVIGAGAQAGTRRRGLALGGLYGLGIAAVYGLLGLAVILTGARFGALNASPWFNLAMALLFGFMALALFGVFHVDLSRFQSGTPGGRPRAGPFVAAFAMGGISALLAGACVAPVVISVLLLAADIYGRGHRAGLLLPFCLGIGMALPWPLAGAGLSFLPRPGRWMSAVKHAFGVLILGFAVWYGYLGYGLFRGRSTASRQAVLTARAEATREAGWLTSLGEALEAARRERKPMFVDFWASWCKNCLQMDHTTFRDPSVVRRLSGYVRVKFRAEDLRDPAVKAVLDEYGVVGLPTYVVLQAE